MEEILLVVKRIGEARRMEDIPSLKEYFASLPKELQDNGYLKANVERRIKQLNKQAEH